MSVVTSNGAQRRKRVNLGTILVQNKKPKSKEIKAAKKNQTRELDTARPKWNLKDGLALLESEFTTYYDSGDNSEDNDHKVKDVQVGTNLSIDNFLDFVDKETHGPKYYFQNGNAFIYEWPNITHESVIGETIGALAEALGRQNARIAGAARCTLPGFSKEPDISISPKNTANPGPGNRANAINNKGDQWPTTVVEVGVSQSLESLHAALQGWMAQAHVQVGLAIKIFGRRANGTRAMIAMRCIYYDANIFTSIYTKTNPNLPEWIVSFGNANPQNQITNWILNNITNAGGVPNAGPALAGVGAGGPACNAANIGAYLLHVPVAGGATSVFYDWSTGNAIAPVAAIPGIQGNHISIDLYEIQQTALSTLA